jgi:hypothetical protein
MRPKQGVYENIAAYVDDLALIAAKVHSSIINVLEEQHQFNSRGHGPSSTTKVVSTTLMTRKH